MKELSTESEVLLVEINKQTNNKIHFIGSQQKTVTTDVTAALYREEALACLMGTTLSIGTSFTMKWSPKPGSRVSSTLLYWAC